MQQQSIEQWLRHQIGTRRAGCWFGAFAALLLGLLVLFLTFWLAYVMIFLVGFSISALCELVFNRRFSSTHGWRLALSGLFIAALFIERLRRSEFDLGHYTGIRIHTISNPLTFQAGSLGGLCMMMVNPQDSATMVTEILYIGPRLVIGAGQLLRTAHLLGRIDAVACAWALEVLANRHSPVAREELVAAWPELDLPKLELDLRLIPGTITLAKGLSLTEEFREELADKFGSS